NGATEIYNVAISDERQAMDAVRACVRNANGIVVKVKSQLTRRLCKALKLRPGEVKRGMRNQKSTQHREGGKSGRANRCRHGGSEFIGERLARWLLMARASCSGSDALE